VGRALAAVVAFTVLAGCGEKRPAPKPPAAPGGAVESPSLRWPMSRGGPELQGRVAARVPLRPAVEWTFQIKGAITSEAAAAEGVVVVGDVEGVIHAVDWQTRRERWQVTTGDTVEATAAIADGRVFIGSDDGRFRALDLADGKLAWQLKGEEKFPTGATVVAGPEGGETRLLVNGYDGISHCLQARDGTLLWRHETEDYINGTPAVLAGGQVAFGGCDAVIHVLQLSDGTEVHSVKSDAQIIRSLAAWQNTVYGVNHANQLLAATTSATEPSWVYEAGDTQFLTSPAVDAARVYVGTRDRHLHAVDRLTGKLRWKFKTAGRVASSPLVFEDAVVFGSSDGRLYAVAKDDGRELWRLDLGEGLENAPAFAGGRIVIGGNDGTLFVIRGEAAP
jgi:outer membrane protein assembly factor BamB